MSHTILLSTLHEKWPYSRQTPGESMMWGESRFVLNEASAKADFLVVYDEPHKAFKTTLPQERRLLVISEPPSIKQYTPDYLHQFGTIITPQRIGTISPEIRQIVSQLSLPWHYGVAHTHRFSGYKTYDELGTMPPPEKKYAVSAMISNKTLNAHHRQRIETARFLKEKLGDQFHLFGRGYKEVDDKAEGIDSFAFHLVCENNDVAHFWTEKLADAYLGWSFPLFSGCANLGDYFPEDSFMAVDLSRPERVLEQIEVLLADPEFYESRLPAIKKARDLVLNRYNLFAMLDDTIKQHAWSAPTAGAPHTLIPQTPKRTLAHRIRDKIRRLAHKVIYRLKNLPPLLPWYFKLVNKNPGFYADYYDKAGKKAMMIGYYGQRGQDWFVDQKIFKGKENGVFLDVGANDPKELSNTLYFEQKGWTGLAFEPQERFRTRWRDERQTPCLPHLLGANDGEIVTFLEYDTDDWQNALSGVEGYALESGINIDSIKKHRKNVTKRRLDSVLREHNITHADFLSLDVEGFEMEVLQGINFDDIDIDVIVVENDRSHLGDNHLRRFIKSKGYDHIARLSGDDVFKKKRA